MDLKDIMSVSGQGGLFKFVSQGRNGIIVESFTDKKRMFVTASQKVSSLNDIAIFTDNDEVPLKDVLKKIHEVQSGTAAPDAKSSPEDLKKFMEKVLPNYDRNRVYTSDLKKLVSWYNTLLELNLLNFEEEVVTESNEKLEEASNEESAKNGDKTKTPSKPATPKKKPAAKKKTSEEL